MNGDAEVAYPLFQMGNGGSIPTSPLQFEICIISTETAKKLNRKWHSRLPIITNPHSGHSVCYGAIYEGIYYACAIWTDPIARAFNHKGYLELRRMAICNDAPKNTASRMLKIMGILIKKKFPNIIKLISYQDTEVHKGTIYKANGWIEANRKKVGLKGWNSRKRNIMQTTSDKIRWEKEIK